MHAIRVDGIAINTINAFMAGPAKATSQQGLIRMGTDTGGQQGKHVLYTLSQRALVEYEDQELEMARLPVCRSLVVRHDDLAYAFPQGAALFMDIDSRIGFLYHTGINAHGMLKAFHRYAMRMIRLDV